MAALCPQARCYSVSASGRMGCLLPCLRPDLVRTYYLRLLLLYDHNLTELASSCLRSAPAAANLGPHKAALKSGAKRYQSMALCDTQEEAGVAHDLGIMWREVRARTAPCTAVAVLSCLQCSACQALSCPTLPGCRNPRLSYHPLLLLCRCSTGWMGTPLASTTTSSTTGKRWVERAACAQGSPRWSGPICLEAATHVASKSISQTPPSPA